MNVPVIKFREEPFGGCPECGQSPHVVNIERANWAHCPQCMTRWPIGWNLLTPSPEDLTETGILRATRLLEQCREVESSNVSWKAIDPDEAVETERPEDRGNDELPF